MKTIALIGSFCARREVVAMLALAALLAPSRLQADTYNINRTFSDGSSVAALTGTLTLPQGNYVIMNTGPSPFTDVNLTLTVNGNPYVLTHALTGLINGTGQFLINAGPTALTFDTATADGANPADLVFSDNFDPLAENRYAIGHNGAPNFEAAYTITAGFFVPTALPAQFGLVPEPGTGALLLLSFGCAGLQRLRRRS